MGNVTLVPFTKTAETEDGLVAKLSVRGLVFSEESELRSLLRTVGYYRIIGYLHSFRQPNSDKYKPGTTLEMVWRLYSFDRRLRLLVMDALSRIEVALRAMIVREHLAVNADLFGYVDPASLPSLRPAKHASCAPSEQVA